MHYLNGICNMNRSVHDTDNIRYIAKYIISKNAIGVALANEQQGMKIDKQTIMRLTREAYEHMADPTASKSLKDLSEMFLRQHEGE